MTLRAEFAPRIVQLVAAVSLLIAIGPLPLRAEQLYLATNLKGDFATARLDGFNLADVANISALDDLPEGMKGVLWLGNGYNTKCAWRVSDEEVTRIVPRLARHPKFSGIYYTSDEPHPANCADAVARVTERSDLIRRLDPTAKTFIVVQNTSADRTEFAAFKDAADYIGVEPYPCNVKNSASGCDLNALTQRINEAIAAGIATNRIVPVFQLFGQECTTSTPFYRMPSGDELEKMLAIWDQRVPRTERPFSMAYSWGVQERTACPALSLADGTRFPNLRGQFSAYMAGRLSRLQEE